MSAKLTIITVCYNAEKFIQPTLDSLIGQSNQQFEFLVIDGKSKDQTMQLVDKVKDKFLNINIVSEKDNGLYDAMNKGQKLASNEYILFINAGDQLFDNKVVERFYDCLGINPDVIYGDAMFIDENYQNIGLRSIKTPHKIWPNITFKDFRFGMKICHQSFIVRKSITLPYIENNLSADIDWEINCLKKASKTHFIETPISKYLVGGISAQKHKESLWGRFKILQKHFGFLLNLINHCWIIIRGFRHRS